MQWEWDPQKDRQNRQKHGVDFDGASRVFNDSFHKTEVDPHPEEERFNTVGRVGQMILIVAHTLPEYDQERDDYVCRIISARKAQRHERRGYEEGIFQAYR